MAFATPGWDLEIFRLLNGGFRNALFDVLMPAASAPWLLWALGAAAFGLLWTRRGLKAALPVLLLVAAIGAADFGCKNVKDAVGRLRPHDALAETWLVEKGQWTQRPPDFTPDKQRGSSFPSAHAANSMAAALLAMLLWRRTCPWLFALPFVIGWSRVYLGKHYPSDVLAGWVLGAFVGVLTYAAFRLACERLALRRARRSGA